jgi:hypothetical protein
MKTMNISDIHVIVITSALYVYTIVENDSVGLRDEYYEYVSSKRLHVNNKTETKHDCTRISLLEP